VSRSNPQPEHKRQITDLHQRVGFGKYAVETVQDVLDNDPGYILWLDANTDIDICSTILSEAEDKSKPEHMFKNWTKRDFDRF
jgi:hypothetical protein